MPAKKKQRLFVKNIKGEDVTQVAYSEADAVRYTFDGWREVTDADSAPAGGAAKKAAAAKADTKTTK